MPGAKSAPMLRSLLLSTRKVRWYAAILVRQSGATTLLVLAGYLPEDARRRAASAPGCLPKSEQSNGRQHHFSLPHHGRDEV